MIPWRTHRAGWALFEAVRHEDERGWLAETFLAHVLREQAGHGASIVQQNLTSSRPGVLRGLHYQITRPQGKLVLVVQGRIFDAIVDLRRDSADFGRSFGFDLDASTLPLLWVPPGFAHGFLARTESLVSYSLTAPRLPAAERALRWDCPAIGIHWPLEGRTPILSRRDREAPGLDRAETFAAGTTPSTPSMLPGQPDGP